jgi:trigger factor
MRGQLEQQGVSTAGMDFDPDLHKEEAERRVKLGLLLSEIIKQKDFKANEEDVDQYLHSLAETYDEPDEVIKWYKGDQNRLAEVQSIVLEKKVVDSVLEEVKVKDKTMSFEEVMGMTTDK